MRLNWVFAATLIAAGAFAACDVGEPPINAISRGFDRPPVNLGIVTATSNYDADGWPQHVALSEDSIAEEVALSASFRLNFDRFLLPHKVVRQSVCVHPATETVTAIADCVEPFQPFTEPEYNPVLRRVTYRLPAGSRLSADTLYRLTVFVTEDIAQNGFFAFDGAPLARSYSFDFRTRAAGGPEVDEPLPTADRYCASIQCFKDCETAADPTTCEAACRPGCAEPSCFQQGDLLTGLFRRPCAFSGCHAAGAPFDGNDDPTDQSMIAMGLDLLTPESIAATAIGETAHQTQQGEAASQPDNAPDRFGRAMPLIDPQAPGNSYLLYKVLANPFNHNRPDGTLEPQLETELGRLTASVVVGLPMPTENGAIPKTLVDYQLNPNGELSQEAMERLNTWIAHGAVTSCE